MQSEFYGRSIGSWKRHVSATECAHLRVCRKSGVDLCERVVELYQQKAAGYVCVVRRKGCGIRGRPSGIRKSFAIANERRGRAEDGRHRGLDRDKWSISERAVELCAFCRRRPPCTRCFGFRGQPKCEINASARFAHPMWLLRWVVLARRVPRRHRARSILMG